MPGNNKNNKNNNDNNNSNNNKRNSKSSKLRIVGKDPGSSNALLKVSVSWREGGIGKERIRGEIRREEGSEKKE